MKKVSVVGRWPLAIVLMIVGSLGLSSAASAGYWRLSYEVSGTAHAGVCTPLPFINPEDGERTADYTLPASSQLGYWVESIGDDKGMTPLKAEIDANVVVVFDWVPDSTQDKAPTKLSVIETLDMTPPRAGSGDYGNPEVVSTHNTTVKGFSGKGLAQLSSSGGTARLTRQIKMNSKADGQYDGMVLEGMVTYYVAIDTRSVKLSRGGQDRSELKDGEWTTYGDTTYSYNQDNPPHQIAGDPLTLRENRQTISANLSGGWSSSIYGYTWRNDPIYIYGQSHSWSPSGDPEDSTGSVQLMPTGQLERGITGKWRGTANEGSHTDKDITYTITDPDGATATAHYKLTVHEPVENISSETNGISIDVDYFNSNGEPHINNSVIKNPLTVTTTVGQSYSVVGTIGTELFEIPLGLELGTEVTTSQEESKTLEAYGALGDDEYVNAKKQLNYNRTHVLFWKYNESGKDRRFVDPMGPPPIEGWSQSDKVEVPHEAISTKFSNWGLFWSEVKRANEGGYPTTATPQPTLPPPSFKYSRKEGKKHGQPTI